MPGELLVLYSDGITEAENPAGQPFEETGLEQVVDAYASDAPAQLAATFWPRSNGTPQGPSSSTI